MTDFEGLAESAGLEYLFDDAPGLRRMRRGRGFAYLDPAGDPVDDATREWIRSLAIPPAWTDVWIAPVRNAHLLATGRDQAGRKQYLYHPDWSEAAGDLKFSRVGAFGRHLPRLRRRVESDLRRHELDRRKVTALAIRILDETLIRVGHRRYVEANDSYGLTTLGPDHAVVSGTEVRFEFTGKGGADHDITVHDRRLAALVARCQDLAGATLFCFDAGGNPVSLTPTDLNSYITEQSRQRFTAKDVRTWGASATAVEALAVGDAEFLEAVDAAATRLGNTRAVARSSYVHPVIGEAAENGVLEAAWRSSRDGRWLSRPESTLRRLVS